MKRVPLILSLLLAGLAVPATAQFQSEGYKFLQAVRDSKANDVIEMLSKPGSTIVNTRDVTNGEGALHITVRRGDKMYTTFLLQKGADPNLRDGKGMTPLVLAAVLGQGDIVPILIAGGANVNLGNSSGETPLIVAVHHRDVAMVRTLLNAGADADQTDIIAGRSARDYALQDSRNPVIAKLLGDAPKKAPKAVSGPKF